MKRGFWEYDPVIYPRKLWVCIGQTEGDMRGWFEEIDGKDWSIECEDYDGLTISELRRKDNGEVGELVVFDSKKDMTMGICTHEASHVCDSIEEAIGMEHGGEASAYLIGWIASCINKARLGIGEFVDKESKREKV